MGKSWVLNIGQKVVKYINLIQFYNKIISVTFILTPFLGLDGSLKASALASIISKARSDIISAGFST